MPKINVIVPVYKVMPFIHRCVDSILAQSFNDFELILVDDGSPDKCGAICDEYAAKDNRIHVIHQKNGGLSAARNAGIDWTFANCESEWLAFIDSDDWVHPFFLDYLYRAVQVSDLKVSACLFAHSDAEASNNVDFIYTKMVWDKYYLRDWSNGVVAWNKLYKKELFQELRYPLGKIHEDEFLTYRLLERAGSVAVVDRELYYYYQNAYGITKRSFTIARLDGIAALVEQVHYAKQKGYSDFYLNRTQALLGRLTEYICDCNESVILDKSEKEKALHYLRSELRKLLLFDGKCLIHKNKQWYYELAYPVLSNVYWTGIGIAGKVMNKEKK